MAKGLGVAVFGLGLLLLVVGIAFSGLITAASEETTTVHEIDDNSSEMITQYLEASVTTNATDENATITIENTQTLNRSTSDPLTASNSTTLSPGGNNVTADYREYRGGAAVFELTYPATAGYPAYTQPFYDNLGLLIAMLGAIITLGGIGGIMRA